MRSSFPTGERKAPGPEEGVAWSGRLMGMRPCGAGKARVLITGKK